jgi:putative flippase GtrA
VNTRGEQRTGAGKNKQASSTVFGGKSARRAELLRHGVRYLLVGLSSAGIELILFALLYEMLDLAIVVANVAAISIATAYNFILSRTWTFQSVSSLPRSAVLYLLLFVWNQCFSSLTIVWLHSLGAPALLAKLVTMGCIVLWNFVLYRKVVFK